MGKASVLEVNQKIAFCVSGCFLFFHEGHQKFIEHAYKLTDGFYPFIIIVNSEEYLKEKHKKTLANLNGHKKISMSHECLEKTRVKKIFDFVKELKLNSDGSENQNINILISDDFYKDYKIDFKTVWVIGNVYKDTSFKEEKKADFVYLCPKFSDTHSSDIIKAR